MPHTLSEHWGLWTVFGALILGVMVLDLGVFHRKDHEVKVKEALVWTGVWVLLGLGFNLLIWWQIDRNAASAEALWPQYLTCYLTEYALSIDNIFVFLVIFTYFAVPQQSRHRVLFWGVLGALVFRALFLVGGVVLIERFHWVVYLLALILVVTGIKLFFAGDSDIEPERNLILRLARRFLPVTEDYEGKHFFVVREGRRFATPLFLTLLVVETTDILFAVDSVPAALGISQDTFVLYTSNVMAIMGLRSLFFAVAGMLQYLYYLKYGLALILCFVGVKMVLPEEHKLSVTVALAVVGGILFCAVAASLVRGRMLKDEEKHR